MFGVYIKRPFPIRAAYFDGTIESAKKIIESIGPEKIQMGSFDNNSGACFNLILVGKDPDRMLLHKKVEDQVMKAEAEFHDTIPAHSYIIQDGDTVRHNRKDYFEAIYMKPSELSNVRID